MPRVPHTVTEGLYTTGTFVFTDVDLTDHHTVTTSLTSATWSGGATLPSGVAAALAGVLSAMVSQITGSGFVRLPPTFSAACSAFDLLRLPLRPSPLPNTPPSLTITGSARPSR